MTITRMIPVETKTLAVDLSLLKKQLDDLMTIDNRELDGVEHLLSDMIKSLEEDGGVLISIKVKETGGTYPAIKLQ